MNRFAGYPAGIIRGKEYGNRSDVLRLTDSTERGFGFDVFSEIAFGDAGRSDAFGLDHAT
jgi:hypothetical protein